MPHLVLTLLNYTSLALCAIALCLLMTKGCWRDYWALGSFLAVRLFSDLTLTVLHHSIHLFTRRTAYQIYFTVYWPALAVEAILAVVMLFGLFRSTMRPLPGIRTLGTIALSLVGVAAVGIALVSGLVHARSGTEFMVSAVSQFQRTQSVLTLCVLLVVFLAMRPVGLSVRSRIFGVGLGLGLMSLNDLVQSLWLTVHHPPSSYALLGVVSGVTVLAVLATWAIYLLLPEPRRGDVQSDSFLARWNRICVAWNGNPI